MRAFVTGGTGLLGNNLVRALRASGHAARALVRSETKGRELLGDTGAEVVRGDMQHVAAFADSLAGCDVVFHTAAYFREYYGAGRHWPKLEAINVRGRWRSPRRRTRTASDVSSTPAPPAPSAPSPTGAPATRIRPPRRSPAEICTSGASSSLRAGSTNSLRTLGSTSCRCCRGGCSGPGMPHLPRADDWCAISSRVGLPASLPAA